MATVIRAPAPLPSRFDSPAVFLAGSIDDGAAEDWQSTFAAAFAQHDVLLLNPRRDHWTAAQGAADPDFAVQVEWELAGLERADSVAMYFAPSTRAPISLLELGLFARSGKLLVACPPGYWRRGNVEMVCRRYGVPLVASLEELVELTRARLAGPKAASPPNRTTLCAGKFLALVKEDRWEYADRINATGAAIIVAVTDERKLLLVEQYRIPVHARTIELPAGIIGDEPGDASPADAARRELLEETGYDAGEVETLMTGPASSGLTSEIVTLFRATRLQRAGKGGGVAHEQITVHEVLLANVHHWLEEKTRSGVLIEPKVYAGLHFLNRS